MSDETTDTEIPEGGYLAQRVAEDAQAYADANPESGLPPNDAEVGYLQRRVAEDAAERVEMAKAQGVDPDEADVAVGEQVEIVDETVVVPPAREDYEAIDRDDLKALARQRGLAVSGTKEDLVDRLVAADQAETPDTTNLTDAG